MIGRAGTAIKIQVPLGLLDNFWALLGRTPAKFNLSALQRHPQAPWRWQLEWPFVDLLIGWPYLVIAQVGAFMLSIWVYLLWPKYPRWIGKSYVLLVSMEFLALVLIVCVIVLAIADYRGMQPVRGSS